MAYIDPQAEAYQDGPFYERQGEYLGDNIGHKRSPVAEMPFIEYDPRLKRWRQGDKILFGYRPHRFLCRPHDGKRAGAWGRLMDALTGEGADVFMTESGDKRTKMRDRPQRHQWTGWDLTANEKRHRWMYDRDFRMQDRERIRETPRSGPLRFNRRLYDFNRRTFIRPVDLARNPDTVLMDAYWRPGATRDEVLPYAWRDPAGDYFSTVPYWAGYYPGGRPWQG